jgi:hypothetical protein
MKCNDRRKQNEDAFIRPKNWNFSRAYWWDFSGLVGNYLIYSHKRR